VEQPKRRVLVADDDPAICTLISTVLRRRGPYEITTCADAESAAMILDHDGPFDVIICDFMLPGISGIDLIERVRASEQTRTTPILMISGHASAVAERATNAGANIFLNKPFTLTQLRNAVATLLS
jgi:CheY-like chemotaxis protein